MLISTLSSLLPFLLVVNALPFESSSAKRDAPIGARNGALDTRGHDHSESNWVPLGCYVDTVHPRVLKGAQTVSDTEMTNEYCQQFCQSHGFSIAGTEWSKECFCDNDLDITLIADNANCDMSCTGGAEICGGGERLTVWKNVPPPPEDWEDQGCYYDSIAHRALPTQIQLNHVTVEKCTTACLDGGFKYAGVEYGSECFCGNEIITGSGNIGTSAPDGCNMPCNGDGRELCGGGNRLNVYSHTVPTQVPSVGDWTLKGCYSDAVSNRALPVRPSVDGGMTVEKCTDKCFSLGYKFSGVEYGSECYCSSEIATYPNSGSPVTDGCDMVSI